MDQEGRKSIKDFPKENKWQKRSESNDKKVTEGEKRYVFKFVVRPI